MIFPNPANLFQDFFSLPASGPNHERDCKDNRLSVNLQKLFQELRISLKISNKTISSSFIVNSRLICKNRCFSNADAKVVTFSESASDRPSFYKKTSLIHNEDNHTYLLYICLMLHRPSPRTAAPPLHRQDTVHATIPAPRNKDSRPLQTTCSHTYACLTMPRTRAVRKNNAAHRVLPLLRRACIPMRGRENNELATQFCRSALKTRIFYYFCAIYRTTQDEYQKKYHCSCCCWSQLTRL